MDFGFTAEQEQFRKEVRDFLEEELMQGSFKPKPDACVDGVSLDFSRKLGQRGWIGLALRIHLEGYRGTQGDGGDLAKIPDNCWLISSVYQMSAEI